MHKKQPHHPTIKVLLSSLTMLIASHTTTIQAENLIQTYELAAKSDPEWHASQEALEANKLFKKMGLSGLLPQIIGTISYSRVDSDADEVPTGISEGFGTSLGLVACVIPTLVDGTETFPAECANTSQLSPLTEFSDCIRDNGGDATSCYFSTAKTGAVDTTSTTIQLTQPLFRLDKWFDYRKSLFQVSKSVSDFESARQDFVLRVAETYFNDLKAKEEIEFSKLEERAIAYQLQTTQKRFKRGIGSSLEVYEAQSVLDINYASKLAIESFGETTHDNLVLLTRSHDIQPDPLPADIPIELPQPNSVDTWVEISRLNSSDLRSAEFAVLIAKQNYKKALKLDPSFQPTRNNYGAFLYQKKRYQDAYDAFIIVAEDPLYPRRFYAYENLGFCAIKLGDFRLAETHFKKALVLNANLFRSLIELAEIQYRKQDFSAVEDYLRQYRDLATLNKIPNSAQILWLKIRTARAQNKGVEQMRNVRKLRSEFPESNEYQMYLNSLSNTSQKVAR